MITEDYVSLEVAKLLKEKGFDEGCFKYAINDEIYNKGDYVICSTEDVVVCIPTIQMAMKWLRNMGIVIEITTCWPSNPDFCMIPYCFRIEDYRKERDLTREHGKYYTGYCSNAGMDVFLKENHLLFDELGFGEFPTYEITVEAAIKYCLNYIIK